MAPEKVEVSLPAAPAYLSPKAKKQWQARFAEALAQAKRDHPENTGAQTAAAYKAANTLLAVPAPETVADADALEDHHKMLDEIRVIKGVTTRVIVTSDGRKYSFPVDKPSSAPTDISKLNKEQLVQHAFEKLGLTLDPASTKAEMLTAIQAAANSASA